MKGNLVKWLAGIVAAAIAGILIYNCTYAET